MRIGVSRFYNWILILLIISLSVSQTSPDIFDKVTTVGQLGMTVTNFGVLGNGWNKINGRILPSCQYKQHTTIQREQIEHFSYGKHYSTTSRKNFRAV